MDTKVIKINEGQENMDMLVEAAGVLREGGLVVFPTETVYGLGANALNNNAVKGIFEAKGRPSDNPLIVHIHSIEQLESLTSDVNDIAKAAIKAFWPGPLTLIFNKKEEVSNLVTAGLNTVAVRMPKHNVALSLLRIANVPVAAPSANISGKPSPTQAIHVIQDLSGKVEYIIDGGSCDVGLESTVLDTTLTPPVILRPGGISLEQLQEVLGEVAIDPALAKRQVIGGITSDPSIEDNDITPRAPGMKYKHYSPEAEVTVVEGQTDKVIQFINNKINEYKNQNKKVGVLASTENIDFYKDAVVVSYGSKNNPELIAASLFDCLREFDNKKVDIVFAEAVGTEGIGFAIMNRMNKAAGYKIIKV